MLKSNRSKLWSAKVKELSNTFKRTNLWEDYARILKLDNKFMTAIKSVFADCYFWTLVKMYDGAHQPIQMLDLLGPAPNEGTPNIHTHMHI